MQTAPAPAYLTCGGWSPTRPGVFYTCRQDGFIDFYDYFYRMNEVAYCHKVSDASILSSALQNHGRLLAVGDSTGTVNLLELCDELWQTPVGKGAGETISEKVVVGNTFDREMRREKNLDAIKKAANRGGGAGEAEADASQMRGVDEAKYITREKAWHKELGIVAEEKDFTIAFDNH
jgi:dynein intermediate chain 2